MTTLADRPVITPELVASMASYLRRNPLGGSMYTMVSNGNLHDDHVVECIDWAQNPMRWPGEPEGPDIGGLVLIYVMLTLTKSQRYHLINRAERTL